MFNKFIVGVLPLVPRPIVHRISQRYIAGDALSDAIEVSRRLDAEEGAWTTIDVLGEFVDRREQAVRQAGASGRVLEAIDAEDLHRVASLSVKPTSMGLAIDTEFAYGNIRDLVRKAGELGISMCIDMENTPYTDRTLDLYRRLREENHDNVGLALQAMLRRTEQDVRDLAEYRPWVRLCKGIYKESEKVAWQGREEVRASYSKLLRLLVENGSYCGIATHDDPLIDDAREVIAAHGLDKDDYEFQMLLGVRENVRRDLLAEGHHLCVYVPFGKDWYGYSTRRLKENPAMAGMIAKAVLLGR